MARREIEFLKDSRFNCPLCKNAPDNSNNNCLVCRNSGQVELDHCVEDARAIRCNYCQGRGRANGTTLLCIACRGKGVVAVTPPVDFCDDCRGRGRSSGSGLTCLKCRGKGVIETRSNDAKMINNFMPKFKAILTMNNTNQINNEPKQPQTGEERTFGEQEKKSWFSKVKDKIKGGLLAIKRVFNK